MGIPGHLLATFAKHYSVWLMVRENNVSMSQGKPCGCLINHCGLRSGRSGECYPLLYLTAQFLLIFSIWDEITVFSYNVSKQLIKVYILLRKLQ